MDDETAQVLFREGATLILADLPDGSSFGIDYNSWTVGPKFRGVKMIPPGIHFVYYSAQDTGSNSGMRSGFFHDFKQRDIVIKKWDNLAEDIKTGEVDEEERERYSSNMRELDQYLGAYPYENQGKLMPNRSNRQTVQTLIRQLLQELSDLGLQCLQKVLKVVCLSYKKWVSLTNHITVDLVLRLLPECGTVTSVTQFLSPMSDSKMRMEAQLKLAETKTSDDSSAVESKKGLPKLDTVPGTEVRFSKIPKQKYPEGATPAEITKHSMDWTYRLNTVLNACFSKNHMDILGEIQFAFICFLIGQKYEAFDQWKRLVHLLCSCEEALNSHTDLFMNFISVLHFQVHEIPEDFFVDIVSANNFLTTTLQEFFSNLDAGNGETKLRRRGQKFREHLTKKFKWDFTMEPDDYAPVVVESCG